MGHELEPNILRGQCATTTKWIQVWDIYSSNSRKYSKKCNITIPQREIERLGLIRIVTAILNNTIPLEGWQ